MEFLAYHHEANALFFHFMEQHEVSSEVYSFMSHVLNAQIIWLDRIEQKPTQVGVWDIHSLPGLKDMDEKEHARAKRILDRHKLSERCFYHNSKQIGFENTIGQIMLHVYNHGTHHRGQVALLIRQMGLTPPASDYIFLRRERIS